MVHVAPDDGHGRTRTIKHQQLAECLPWNERMVIKQFRVCTNQFRRSHECIHVLRFSLTMTSFLGISVSPCPFPKAVVMFNGTTRRITTGHTYCGDTWTFFRTIIYTEIVDTPGVFSAFLILLHFPPNKNPSKLFPFPQTGQVQHRDIVTP